MDYGAFRARSERDWDALAGLLRQIDRRSLASLDHEQLERFAAYHRKACADFAYAQTYFPDTEIVHHLRALTFAGHRILGRKREAVLPKIWAFYLGGYRRDFRARLPALGASLGLFIGASLLGYAITMVNTGFAALYLGPDMIKGLRQGEIWTDSVTQVLPPALLSGRILTNNISVALVTWLGGASFGLITALMVMNNGLMFGSVLYLTWHYHLLDALLRFVAAHGPLELSLIVVAGAAGFELARGQLTRRREAPGVALPRAARRSWRLVAGTIPWFVVLGLVEGYISPIKEIELWVKVLLGVLLLVTFLAYALAPPSSVPSPKAAEKP